MRRGTRRWSDSPIEVTPERLFSRRGFLKAAGGSLGLAAVAPTGFASVASTGFASGTSTGFASGTTARGPGGSPAASTPEAETWGFKNYLELGTPNRPSPIEHLTPPSLAPVRVEGLIERPGSFDVAALHAIGGDEERIYRHRCVEGWSAVIPWSGLPLAALVDHVRPLDSARFVRFVAAPPAVEGTEGYPWPYAEALTIDEARNELPLLATGIYGHELPLQHGAPLRLVVPWKYAYKGVKAVRTIEFVDREPATFWTTRAPHEYSFHGNVDPDVPHPRWSQRYERLLGSEEPQPTLRFNGYGKWVEHLYA